MLSRIRQNPILRKELRRLSRQRSSWLLIVFYLAIDLIALALVTAFTEGIPESALARAERYRIILSTLSVLQAFLAFFFPPGAMAQAIAGERERRIWDLLRVTSLSSHDLLLGKYLALLTWTLIRSASYRASGSLILRAISTACLTVAVNRPRELVSINARARAAKTLTLRALSSSPSASRASSSKLMTGSGGKLKRQRGSSYARAACATASGEAISLAIAAERCKVSRASVP